MLLYPEIEAAAREQLAEGNRLFPLEWVAYCHVKRGETEEAAKVIAPPVVAMLTADRPLSR